MTLKRIILTSRPFMWPWTAVIYLVGVGNFSNFSALSIVELLFFTFPLNFYLYGLNDIYDVKSDRINERKKDFMGLSPNDKELDFLKWSVWISAALFIIVALLSRNLEHIILSLAFVFLSFAYSHKSIRIKEIPILDCLCSASIYLLPGLIAFSLKFSIFSLPHFFFFIILAYAGIHALTTLVDAEADEKAGMKTTSIVLGKNGTISFCLAMFIISLVVFWDFILLKSLFLVAVFMLLTYLILDKNKEKYTTLAMSAVLISLMSFLMVYLIFQNNSIT